MMLRTKLARAVAVLGVALGATVLTLPAHADEEEHPPAAAPPAQGDKAADHPAGEHKDEAKKDEAHKDDAHPAASGSGSAEAAGSAAAAAGSIDVPDDEGELSKEDEIEGNKIGLGCHGDAEDGCTKAYAEFIKKIIPKVKAKALEKLEAKIDEKQAKKMQTLSMVLFFFGFTGLLLLLMPLFLAKKYPGKGGVIFKFSGIAAISTVVVLELFAGVVILLKTVQGALGKFTNPQLKIVVAALDGIEEEAEHLVTMGPQLIQPTLDHVLTSDDPVPVALLENVKNVAKDVEPFIAVAKWFKGISWIFEYVPILMTTIAVFLFVVGARPIVKELILLPQRAAAGEDTSGVIREAFRKVGREFLAALMLILGLIVVTLFASEMLALAIKPAVKSFLDYFFATVIYIQHPGAQSSHIFGSLVGIIVFLGLNMAVIIVSSSTYLGKFHKIFQAKFQRQVPLGNHKQFWLWGTLSLVWVQIFPFVFMLGAEPLVDHLAEKAYAKDQPNWTMALLSGPVIFVVGFVLLFWIFRGFKGFGFLFKYKPEPPQPAAEPAGAAAPPAA